MPNDGPAPASERLTRAGPISRHAEDTVWRTTPEIAEPDDQSRPVGWLECGVLLGHRDALGRPGPLEAVALRAGGVPARQPELRHAEHRVSARLGPATWWCVVGERTSPGGPPDPRFPGLTPVGDQSPRRDPAGPRVAGRHRSTGALYTRLSPPARSTPRVDAGGAWTPTAHAARRRCHVEVPFEQLVPLPVGRDPRVVLVVEDCLRPIIASPPTSRPWLARRRSRAPAACTRA